MNCPEWEERIAAGDPEAAGHVRTCPACAALAADLERDAGLLRWMPPEAAEVDYAALRARARREAGRRRWQPAVWAALAAAAALLIAFNLPRRREAPPLPFPAPPAPVEIVRTVPPPPPVAPAARPRPRRRRAEHDLDRRFADFLRAQAELRHPTPPPAGIATRNPNVTIILVEASKGDSHE